MLTFTNSYLVTNRQPASGGYGSHPHASGALSYLTAPTPGSGVNYQSDVGQYSLVDEGNTTGDTLPAAFASALISDLQLTVVDTQPAQLTVFIHGLDTDWTGAATDLGLVGTGLQGMSATGGCLMSYDAGSQSCQALPLNTTYGGLIIGFSWPDVPLGLDFIGDFHATRIQANTSGPSLANLLQALAGLASNFAGGLTLNILAHSEGTYVTQQVAASLPAGQAAIINQVLLLAADLDTTALGPYAHKAACGIGLSQAAAQVTAYWSTGDDVLGDVGIFPSYILTQLWGPCVRDGTIGRLGKSGPPADQTLYANCLTLDCSAVVTKAQTCSNEKTHVAYFYMPLVLQDMAQVLNGQSPSGRSGTGSRQTLND